ncbi:MAG: hypothetical protein M3R17_20065 [Bacteroidota bacterium]|nr:hypothetical protein [Bacteroidota bacterium]
MKARLIFHILISVMYLCSGCKEVPDKAAVHNSIDTTEHNAKPIPQKNNSFPSDFFLALTDYLDSLGFSYDTARIEKVSYYSSNSFRYHDKTFYKMNFMNSFSNDDTGYVEAAYALFSKAESVTGYFYSDKNPVSATITDGIIEEWKFASHADAEKAGLELNRIKPWVYFHTSAYVARQKHTLYVFHNRAAFDHIHKQTIKRFDKQFDVIYPAYSDLKY